MLARQALSNIPGPIMAILKSQMNIKLTGHTGSLKQLPISPLPCQFLKVSILLQISRALLLFGVDNVRESDLFTCKSCMALSMTVMMLLLVCSLQDRGHPAAPYVLFSIPRFQSKSPQSQSWVTYCPIVICQWVSAWLGERWSLGLATLIEPWQRTPLKIVQTQMWDQATSHTPLPSGRVLLCGSCCCLGLQIPAGAC